MAKLPLVSGQEVRKALEKLGFTFLRQHGSHAILRRGSRGCVGKVSVNDNVISRAGGVQEVHIIIN